MSLENTLKHILSKTALIYDFQNKMDYEPKSQTILKHFSSLSVIK